MRGVRPRSPSACPEPAGPPPPGAPGAPGVPGAPGPAKRRRVQEPVAAEPRPQPGLPAPPAPPPAAAPLTSIVVLAAGCALQVPLDHVDLLLEPAPTSVLSVSLPGHTLLLVPEGLLEAAGQCRSPGGLALPAVLDAAAEDVVLQQGFVCAAPTEMAGQGEASEDHADPELLLAFRGEPAAGWAAGLCLGAARGSSRGSGFDLDFELWRPLPGSPLQPLPPSPSPGPPEPPGRPQRPPRPACKARRRLFQE
ncbi:proline-rich protein 23A-like [Lepus europaeus]|uniref:proline-rich protein 23A-like n=1 Tax=Lepus europaeus TaxID=9983 RepID=UPI002B4A7086|nr:proline-rich protein 23A-like [Lepus europaeus]